MLLFNPAMALKAQLNSGYRNADYALAEIVDNSIEAHAKNIDIFIIQKRSKEGRQVWRTDKVAVLDDGHGMSEKILSSALTFGYGTHVKEAPQVYSDARGKMGKFGYGLPNSSVSQARKVSVWSWQNPIGESSLPLYSSLDVDEILSEEADAPSQPIPKKIYPILLSAAEQVGSELGTSGTLVCWENTDRLQWKKARSLFEHLQQTLGRIYRKYISEDKINIFISIFSEEDGNLTPILKRHKLLPFDPLFLDPTGFRPKVLESFDGALAEEFQHVNLRDELEVEYKGKKAKITFKFSTVTAGARSFAPGSSDFGQLCEQNSGFSICRAGRELELSKKWFSQVNTLNRWVRAEIDFPPALDDIFGVTNNKQSATLLTESNLGNWDEFVETYNLERNSQLIPIGDSSENNLSQQQVLEELVKNGDTRWVIVEINQVLSTAFKKMLSKVRQDGSRASKTGITSPTTHTTDVATNIADEDANHNKENNQSLSVEEAEHLANHFIDNIGRFATHPEKKEDLLEKLKDFLKDDKKSVQFLETEMDASSSFFFPQRDSGKTVITLNTYNKWVKLICEALLDIESQDYADPQATAEAIERKFELLQTTLKLLFYAWGKAELDTQRNEEKRASSILRTMLGYNMEKLVQDAEKAYS